MLFLYLVVVNYVHLRFLGLPLDLWGVGGGGVVCKVIFRQHAASIYGFVRFVSSRQKKFRPLLSKVGG